MKPLVKLFIGILTVNLPLLCSAESERFFENREYNAKTINELELEFDHADIQVSEGSDDKIYVSLEQKIKWGDKENCLHTLESETHTSNSLKIFNKSHQEYWSFWNCNVDRKIRIVLGSPLLTKLSVKGDHGNLNVEALSADSIKISVDHGDLYGTKISSSTAKLKVDHGNLSFGNINAKIIQLDADHGDVKANQLSGDQLNLTAAHGNVTLDRGNVKTSEFNQSHADLNLKEWAGVKVSATSDHGFIRIDHSTVENVDLSNDHGSTYYDGTSLQLIARSHHGDIDLQLENSNFEKIDSTNDHGNIDLQVPHKSVCQLQLMGESKQKGDLLKSPTECTEKQNLPIVKLGASNGDVTIIGF